MTDERIEVRYERSFDMLLFDSIEALMQAENFHEVEGVHQTLVRSSVLSSLLILEAVANTCIESLDLGKSVLGEIDRLPVLAKFDFYLRAKFKNRCIDRGIKAVEGLRELKSLRDGFVHLKPYRVEWRYEGDDGAAEAEKTTCLGIARNPRFLAYDDAVRCMAGVHGFLRYFFKDKCKHGRWRVAALLFSDQKIPVFNSGYAVPVLPRRIKAFLKVIEIDLSYVKLI